jgi:hypothetical protein
MIGFGVNSLCNLGIGDVPECSILHRSGLRLVINIGPKLTDYGDERLLMETLLGKFSGTLVFLKN